MQKNDVRFTPEQPEPGAYLDSLDNTAEDLRDIGKEKKKAGGKADRIAVTVLAALNAAVLIFIAVVLHRAGGTGDFSGLKNSHPFDPAVDYYNGSLAFGDTLSPTLRGVKFPAGIQEAFRPIYSANTDTVGWVRIPGTCVDYPVLKAENNEKYERANFYLQSDHRGSIWMDYRNALGRSASSLSKVTILYGHHLTTDECIFAQLENYLDVEYYKAHPVIEMNTIYDNYKWKVFACFITNVEPQDDNGHVFYYWDPAVTDDETLAFTGEILSRSWFRNLAVDLRATDKFLCLSTCTYMLNKPEYIESRCVVMARLVRDGESEQVDVSGAVPNEEHRMPQVWYTQQGIANPYRNVPVFNEY